MVEKAITIPVQLAATATGFNPFTSIRNPIGSYDDLGDPGIRGQRATGPTYDQLQESLHQQSLQSIIQAQHEDQKYNEERIERMRNMFKKKSNPVPEQSNTLDEPDDLPTDQQEPAQSEPEIQQEIEQEPVVNEPYNPLNDPEIQIRQQRLNELFAELNRADNEAEQQELIGRIDNQDLVDMAVQRVPADQQQSFREYLYTLGAAYIRFLVLGERHALLSKKRTAAFIMFTEVVTQLYKYWMKKKESDVITDQSWKPMSHPPEIKLEEFKEIQRKLPPQCRSDIFINPRTKQPEMIISCKFEDEQTPRIYRRF